MNNFVHSTHEICTIVRYQVCAPDFTANINIRRHENLLWRTSLPKFLHFLQLGSIGMLYLLTFCVEITRESISLAQTPTLYS